MKSLIIKNSRLLLLLIIFALLIIILALLLPRTTTKKEPILNQPNYAPKTKQELDYYDISKYPPCKNYGDQLKEKYFSTYTVQRGDSLLSIAKNQLGNSAKYKLIIWYNQKEYPHLSTDLQNTLLEPGWKLTLPPSYAPDDAILQIHSGHVMKHIDGTNWGIVANNSYFLGFNLDSFKYDSGETPHIGDCATIVSDGYLHIYKFEKQIN